MKTPTFPLFTILVILLMSFSQSVHADDFNIRGIHIDMRAQVMTVEGLKALADEAAENNLNAIIMEWAGSFPFEKNAILRNKYSYTEDEVRWFIGYCRERGIDVIPLQNCFGHADYILDQPRYAHLRGLVTDHEVFCSSKLEDDKVIAESLFEDIVRLHPSQYIHIGCDEVHQDCPQCKERIEKDGFSRLFIDYVTEMCKIVRRLGKTPVIWGDVLLHHPEAIDDLPEDVIIMDWHYYNNPTAEEREQLKKLMASGHSIWGAPSLRCWPDDLTTATFIWKNHFDNIREFIPYAREMKYDGIVITSWSTGGHYSYLFNAYDELLFGTPIRQAFPLEGVDILQDAYAAAIASEEPQDTEQFIRGYCRDRFGFNDEEQQSMIEFFLTPENSIATSSSIPDKKAIREELATALKLQKIIHSTKFRGPGKYREAYKYLKFFADTRVNYLQFNDVYCDCQDPLFDASMRSGCASRLEPLIKDADRLARRFHRLAKSYLKDPGYAYGDWGYNIKMKELYLSLK